MGLKNLFTNELTTLQLSSSQVRTSLENPATPLAYPAEWLLNWTGGEPTASGEPVNEISAMQCETVYLCVKILSESIASLPLYVYERVDRGRKLAEETDLFNLLAYEPNPEMTAFTFIECLTGNLVLTGNGYAEIERNGAGQAVALWPRHALNTKPIRLPNGLLAYQTTIDGQHSPHIIRSEDMLHIPALAMDGLVGISPIRQARQAIGLSLAAEKFGARFFGNNSVPGGVLSLKSDLSEKARLNLKSSWEAAQSGVNQRRVAVLEEGVSWTQIGVSPEDSQFLQTRQYQRASIAAMFGVPPHRVGDTTRLSNNNHENQGLEFVTQTLRPYLVRWEQEIQRKLMPSLGRNSGKYFVRFDISEQIRGDFQSTAQGLAIGRQWGWYSINDVREQLGENPIPGPEGDVYMVPLNMIDAATASPASVDQQEPQEEDPATAGAPVQETNSQQQSLEQRFITSYSRLFRDAIGRVSARDKKDSEAIYKAFEPVLAVIAEETKRRVIGSFNLSDTWDCNTDKQIRDVIKSMVPRATTWTVDKQDEITAAEIQKAVRSIVLNIYKDGAVEVATKGNK